MRTLFFALLTLLITACGGGSSDSSSSSAGTSLTGVLVDSAVEGIGYRTETKNGFTNAKGEFNYASGETIIFFIGDLELPPVAAKAVITPLDIAGTDEIDNQAAVNISILLQSLDMDADPSNGIRIDYEELKTVAEEVDFEQPIDNFSTAIGNLASAAGNSVVTEINAVEHLKGTLKTLDISFSSKSGDSSMNSVSSEAISSSSKSSAIVSSVMPVSSVSNSVVAVSSTVVAVSSKTNSSVASSKASVGVSKSSLAAVSSTANSSLVSSIKSSATSSAKSSAASSVWTQGVNDKGFTLITPSTDSKLIYVSNSEGDDANDCLSEAKPCKTIEAGRKKMRADYPDHLYLKRGDIWRDQALNNFPSGRSIEEPAVVAFYGATGARPKLEVTSPSTIGRDVGFIHIIGLEFAAYKMDPSHPEFTGANKANVVMVANHHDILFEDNKFDYVEMVSHKHDGKVPRNLTLRRNIWTGAYTNETSYHRNVRPSNIYAGVWDNFSVIENVFDHGGWNDQVTGAGANMFNHNIYLQEGVVTNTLIQGNIITRGSSHGIQMRSGGLAEDNFFARNAVSLSIGYQTDLLPPGVKAHLINNVVSEGHSMIKGVDPCQNNIVANLCTSAVWGIDLGAEHSGDFDYIAKGNIVSLLAPGDEKWRTMESAIKDKDNNVIGTYTWEERYQLNVSAMLDFNRPNVEANNNIAWKWSLNPAVEIHNYPDPDRTLADYNAHLGGPRSFESFMDVVLNRPLQTWDEKYSAYAINDYIRAGFGMTNQ